MKFQNQTDFRHDAPEGLGILLVNLGTPDAPTTAAVRRYLAEFLGDPRVVEMPRPLWWLILHGVILRIRPARSAHAYQAVWTDRGSPLLDLSQRLADALGERLRTSLPGPVHLELGMCYGNPSIPAALARLRAANCRRLLVLPLYPQYSATTTAASFDAVTRELSTWRWVPELRTVNQYHDDPGHIEALAQSIRDYWASHGRPDRLLFSFHGIPKDYFLSGDPYHCQCQKTARLVTQALDLPRESWALTFQSRVGAKEWLRPYTDETLKAWGAEGVGSVQVVCPGFAVDCLETLEEVAVENRGYFLGAGGRDYGYIPALNDTTPQVQVLADLVRRHVSGWPEAEGVADPDAGRRRLERARAAGASA
jgi:protoporphyrin/coproporphyrin ferrochelatase